MPYIQPDFSEYKVSDNEKFQAKLKNSKYAHFNYFVNNARFIEESKYIIINVDRGCEYNLMKYYLDEAFDPAFLSMVGSVRSDHYYVNMMIAWYFATALAKQYVPTLSYLKTDPLDKWTHNKTIQKAVESFRITDVQKQYLRILKRK